MAVLQPAITTEGRTHWLHPRRAQQVCQPRSSARLQSAIGFRLLGEIIHTKHTKHGLLLLDTLEALFDLVLLDTFEALFDILLLDMFEACMSDRLLKNKPAVG